MNLVFLWTVVEQWDGCPQENVPPADKSMLYIARTKREAEEWWAKYVEPSWKRNHCWIETAEGYIHRDKTVVIVNTAKLGAQSDGERFEQETVRRKQWELEQKKKKKKQFAKRSRRAK